MNHLKSLKRGEIWLVDLGHTRGAEIEKTRPAVIMTDDDIGVLPLRVVVPLTHWQDNFTEGEWLIKISSTPEDGLDQTSAADTFQVRSVSEERTHRRIGTLSEHQVTKITEGLIRVLGLRSNLSTCSNETKRKEINND